MTLDSVLIA